MRLESKLHKLRLETESIWSNVRRASYAEDPKKTSSNYRITIVWAEEHVRETSPAVLTAKATRYQCPQNVDNRGTTQITSAFGEHEMGELKGSNMEINDLRHGVVSISKNLVNNMLICSSDCEGLIENLQLVHNPAILRVSSKKEEIINSINSKSVCSQEVVTDLLPETYAQSLLNVPNENLVVVESNALNVQTNGQGIKESKRKNISTIIYLKIKQEMDDPGSHLIGGDGYCSQEVINLILIGKAVPNLFDGDLELNSGGSETTLLRGIPKQSKIGLLSLYEYQETCTVGDNYKNPIYPIWIMLAESHFTVLFAVSKDIYKKRKSKDTFVLYHYDGLAKHHAETVYTINPAANTSIPPKDKSLPIVIRCIYTRWPYASVETNEKEINEDKTEASGV
ncbi:probable ubiquitin carboxyl-terminal hydrolase MINDY-4 [Trichonephila inaurata madagascariensis]|uniref:Ubiquitin carboxyl-terminal hydrolase MINDY n=1 Tax=Trichonephila inaurata madagascariensis TaxID=2747483 RepID=A0A8X7BSX3_9ARAC|nr:probable ubiquitin carboxyl-terminal hydrolase MINDY-4 [Trichonephila inaurata madagascariensis]